MSTPGKRRLTRRQLQRGADNSTSTRLGRRKQTAAMLEKLARQQQKVQVAG